MRWKFRRTHSNIFPLNLKWLHAGQNHLECALKSYSRMRRGWGGKALKKVVREKKVLKYFSLSPEKILAKVLQFPLWCVWFWLLPFFCRRNWVRHTWCLEQRITVKKSGQSQCMREMLEWENLLQSALDGGMTRRFSSEALSKYLCDVVCEEYVQKKVEITYA